MKITAKTSLKQFVKVYSILPAPASLHGQIDRLPIPAAICGKDVPCDLDEITMGQLLDLQAVEPQNALVEPLKIVLGLTDKQIAKCRAIEVLGFSKFIGGQLTAIAQKFDAIPSTITAEERRAGAEKLNFGMFGIIDAYARRMGIANHDEVLTSVPWLRIWLVMKNDAQTALYERRLRAIYNKTK